MMVTPISTEELLERNRLLKKGKCPFQEYVGHCEERLFKDKKFCRKHLDVKRWSCFECGKQATRYCCNEGTLVCGEAQCDKHDHFNQHYGKH